MVGVWLKKQLKIKFKEKMWTSHLNLRCGHVPRPSTEIKTFPLQRKGEYRDHLKSRTPKIHRYLSLNRRKKIIPSWKVLETKYVDKVNLFYRKTTPGYYTEERCIIILGSRSYRSRLLI